LQETNNKQNKMSKKVTSLTGYVQVEGTNLCAASDGTIRAVGTEINKKGMDVEDYDIAVTKTGLAAIKKAAVILLQIEKLKVALDKINCGQAGEYGQVCFTSEDDEEVACVRVGCTQVFTEDLGAYMKKLGL